MSEPEHTTEIIEEHLTYLKDHGQEVSIRHLEDGQVVATCLDHESFEFMAETGGSVEQALERCVRFLADHSEQ